MKSNHFDEADTQKECERERSRHKSFEWALSFAFNIISLFAHTFDNGLLSTNQYMTRMITHHD